jgi:voltage-gated potassium channel
MLGLLIALTAVGLVAATVGIHAAGTHALIRSLVRRFADPDGLIKPHKTVSAVIWTAIVLLVLHVIEIYLWALAHLFLVPGDQMDTLEEALYFSFVTYTTLGYGDITLAEYDWRVLSGIEALDGILLAGWSTALLFVVVQRSWKGIGRGHAATSADKKVPNVIDFDM